MTHISRNSPKIDQTSPTLSPTEGAKIEKKKDVAIKDTLESRKSAAQKAEYKADIKQPVLEAPAKKSVAFTESQKRVVKFEFDRYVSERLERTQEAKAEAIQEAIRHPEKLKGLDAATADRAKKIAADSTEHIQERFNLNNNWNINSQDRRDWTPEKTISTERTVNYDHIAKTRIESDYQDAFKRNMETYIRYGTKELTPQVVTGLRDSLRTEKPADEGVALHYDYVNSFTVENIRSENLLPPTWRPGTKNIEDWKALEAGAVDPVRTSELHMKSLLDNMQKFAAEAANTVTTLKDKLPPGELKNLFDTPDLHIFKIYRELEKIMQGIQLADANAMQSVAKRREGRADREYDYKDTIAKAQFKLYEEQEASQSKLNIIKWVLTGFAIAATAIAVFIGLALAFKTGGLSMMIAVGIAGALISGAMIGLDKAFGITEKLMEGLTKFVELITPKDSPQWLKDAIKYTIVAALLVIAIIATVALSLGTKGAATYKVIKINEATLLAVTGILNSQVIGFGVQLASTVTLVVTRFMVPLIQHSPVGYMIFGRKPTLEEAELVANVVQAFITFAFALIAVVLTVGKSLSGLSGAGSAVKRIGESFKSTFNEFYKMFTGQVRNSAQLGTFLKTVDHFLAAVPIEELLRMGGEIYSGTVKRSTFIASGEFEKYKGEIEAVLHVCQEVSQLISKHFQQMQSDFQSNQEFISEIKKMFTSLLDKWSVTTSQLYNA